VFSHGRSGGELTKPTPAALTSDENGNCNAKVGKPGVGTHAEAVEAGDLISYRADFADFSTVQPSMWSGFSAARSAAARDKIPHWLLLGRAGRPTLIGRAAIISTAPSASSREIMRETVSSGSPR